MVFPLWHEGLFDIQLCSPTHFSNFFRIKSSPLLLLWLSRSARHVLPFSPIRITNVSCYESLMENVTRNFRSELLPEGLAVDLFIREGRQNERNMRMIQVYGD